MRNTTVMHTLMHVYYCKKRINEGFDPLFTVYVTFCQKCNNVVKKSQHCSTIVGNWYW